MSITLGFSSQKNFCIYIINGSLPLFQALVTELLEVATPETYTQPHKAIKDYPNFPGNDDHPTNLLNLRHDRCLSIFRVFTGNEWYSLNQGEVGHASRKNLGETGLSLHQAAELDTRNVPIIKAELQELIHAAKDKGCGSFLIAIRGRKKKTRNQLKAKKFSEQYPIEGSDASKR